MTHPDPDDPRDILGDPLWDVLGSLTDPEVPAGFDASFHDRLHAPPPQPIRHDTASWRSVAAGLFAAAATAALVLRPLPPTGLGPDLPENPDLAMVSDLDLVANLQYLEDLDLLMDADVLLAWDGTVPR